MVYVTSFSSIPYCSKRENWTQKRTQSENIHSIILDVHVLKAERQNSPFLSMLLMLDTDLTLYTMLCPIKVTSNTIELNVKV